MMISIITYFKLWNVWRKKSLNGKFYKILVLVKMAHSPTFEFEINDFNRRMLNGLLNAEKEV